jgi:hypothetical protein
MKHRLLAASPRLFVLLVCAISAAALVADVGPPWP